MQDSLPKCKCCLHKTYFVGDLDFNKTCEDGRAPGGRVFQPSPERVPYYACTNCGFIFTDFCDQWTDEDFKNRIYNDDYVLADPDRNPALALEETVSYRWGKQLAAILNGNQQNIRLLDFGAGGNPGPMGRALIDRQFDVTSYEPFLCEETSKPVGRYDVIYAIEVIEHCQDVLAAAQLMAEHLDEHGFIYLSTSLHPFPTPEGILQSWYIAPRNGHISIFTLRALTILMRKVGLNLVETVFGLVAFRKLPKFPNQIFI